MTKTALLLVMFALPLTITGCGNSDSQPKNPGEVDDANKVCTAMQSAGLTKQCAVSGSDNSINVVIDSNDYEEARKACAGLAEKMTQQTASLPNQWKLRIFSPYRSDKALATCHMRSTPAASPSGY